MAAKKVLIKATVLITAALTAPLVTLAQDRNISFVACPIFQDTNTVPCWLAEYDGELYFLGLQTDASGWSPPLQGHQLLGAAGDESQPIVAGRLQPEAMTVQLGR